MSNKVKIILAVVLLVVAVGAIAYYLSTSRAGVDPLMERGPGTPAPVDATPNG